MALFIIATLAVSAGFGGWLLARNVAFGERGQTPVGDDQTFTRRTEIERTEIDNPRSSSADAQGQTQAGAVKPGDPAGGELSNRPDLPLRELPRTALAPKFLIEHRTALKGHAVRVRGFVVAVPDTAGENSPAGKATVANANPQPRVFLADISGKNRNKNYDLMIMLREGDVDYKVGARVEIKGVVEAGVNTVYLRKTY